MIIVLIWKENIKVYKKRLLEINPKAFYTSCGCHNLNLVLCDVTNSCGRAISFFGVVQCIYSLFSSLMMKIFTK